MCGRFTLRSSPRVVAELFGLDEVPNWEPRYNIAPSQLAPVVRMNAQDRRRHLDLLHWGLVPFWADDVAIGNRLINARSDTAATKPAFRAAMRDRRCLVVADGFFEWQTPATSAKPSRNVSKPPTGKKKSAIRSPGEVEDLLAPAPDDWLVARPVGTYVNNPKHDGAECVATVPVERAEPAGPSERMLF